VVGFVLGVLVFGVLLVPGSGVFAAAADDEEVYVSPLVKPCATVEVVFARGSGQDVSTKPETEDNQKDSRKEDEEVETEAMRFQDQVELRVKLPLTANFYELGGERVGGFRYPAVKVDGWSSLTGLGAKVTSGRG